MILKDPEKKAYSMIRENYMKLQCPLIKFPYLFSMTVLMLYH